MEAGYLNERQRNTIAAQIDSIITRVKAGRMNIDEIAGMFGRWRTVETVSECSSVAASPSHSRMSSKDMDGFIQPDDIKVLVMFNDSA